MKKSYIRILIFEIILVLIILFNNFVINELTKYMILGYLILGFFAFRLLLSKEKTRYRNTKDMVLNVVIYAVTILVITSAFGVFTSFNKVPNYWTGEGAISFILPTYLFIFISAIFRHALVQKSEGSKLLMITTTILFVIVELLPLFNGTSIDTPYAILIFLAFHVLPIIAKNILFTYLSLKVGWIPVIVYLVILETYMFYIPYYPEFGEYINSMIKIITPSLFLFISIRNLYESSKYEDIVYDNTLLKNIISGVVIAICALFIYLTSGYFHYFIIAIGSGSMTPALHKGDMIVVEKLKEKEKYNVKIGDILVYKYDKITVVHRIVDIYTDSNSFIVYTKGDANEDKDNYPITPAMMVGLVRLNIPLIGYTTIVVNEKL